MTSSDVLELVSQEGGLIKSTPTEETMKKIAQMRKANVRARNNNKIIRIATHALAYVVKYLKNRHHLSYEQIKNLSSEDLNRIPEMIFADRGKRVLLLGWAPLFGWVFAGRYLLFKSRIRYLRLLKETIFDKANVQQAIDWTYRNQDY